MILLKQDTLSGLRLSTHKPFTTLQILDASTILVNASFNRIARRPVESVYLFRKVLEKNYRIINYQKT